MKIDCDLMLLYYLNQSTHPPWHSIFIVLYTILILTAFILNSIVFIAACRRIQEVERSVGNKRASRYILIAHLCAFDIMLTFTMPMTAVDAMTKFWPFGSHTEILCRISKSASAFVVYATSMIIIIIAIDSFRQISCPTGHQLSSSTIYKITPFVLMSSLTMASPLFFFSRLIFPGELQSTNNESINEKDSSVANSLARKSYTTSDNVYLNKTTYDTTFTQNDLTVNYTINDDAVSEYMNENNTEKCPLVNHGKEMDWSHVLYCVEDWRWESNGEHSSINRIYYSVFSIIMQHFIPCITVSVLYYKVYRTLRQSHVIRRFILNMTNESVQNRENERAKATNRTLVAISMVYCFCWLPLNFIGVLLDVSPEIFGQSTERMIIIFMACHVIGMSSTCINPIIYGYFHEHIREGMHIYLTTVIAISTISFIFSNSEVFIS